MPTRAWVKRGEALPCTGPRQPINFEVFSAGPTVDGLPLTGTARRCDPGALADESPANYVSYIYGHCEIEEGNTGCAPPLEIQTWPACQRSLGDYTFEGKPMPYRRLPSIEGAQVVEIEFPFGRRFEVYTGSSTIVIFAADPAVVQAALEALSSQEEGNPPETKPAELAQEQPGGLAPPVAGATEGDLKCSP